MITQDDAELFEASIRQQLIERKKELGFSDERLGKVAFPYMPAPKGKVSNMLSGQGKPGKRKPQQLRFTDVIAMCEALGLAWEKVGRNAMRNVK